MKPSKRSLELAQIALQSAASACGSPFPGESANELSALANDYRTAERELEELEKELYP